MLNFMLGFIAGLFALFAAVVTTTLVFNLMHSNPKVKETAAQMKEMADGTVFKRKKYKPDNEKGAKVLGQQRSREIEEELSGIFDDGVR